MWMRRRFIPFYRIKGIVRFDAAVIHEHLESTFRIGNVRNN
jgi:hypothetical protein